METKSPPCYPVAFLFIYSILCCDMFRYGYGAGVLPGPNFVGKIKNVTVTASRDAILTCKVEHLRGYKVAWVQVDTQTILTIHNTVITRNPRVGLSREGQNVYNLHLKDVQEEDRGWYMCQINTDPMIKELGFLQVVVPPDFEESSWSGDLVVRENTNVSLECKARGYPPPTVSWRKEDPKDPTKQSEKVWEGETLVMEKVSRLNMGAYLCVASNGIQPTVSKRIQLRVQFPPMLWIPNQLEGANWGEDAVLECNTEAFPRSINYWTNEKGEMIAEGTKYSTETREESYKTYMRLTIHNLTDEDFSVYRCIAKNSLGETDGSIKLYEIRPKPSKETAKPGPAIGSEEGGGKKGAKNGSKGNGEGEPGKGGGDRRNSLSYDTYGGEKIRNNNTKYWGGRIYPTGTWRDDVANEVFPDVNHIYREKDSKKKSKDSISGREHSSPFDFRNSQQNSSSARRHTLLYPVFFVFSAMLIYRQL